MTNNKLWVDDVRPTPSEEWDLALTSKDAIFALQNGSYEHLSLDHDLGGDDTSRAIVLWMCEQSALEKDFVWPTHLYVHSANPVGVEWLVGMLSRYAPEGSTVYR